MHPKSETELLTFAQDFIERQRGDVEAARKDYRDEARARYSATDDGDRQTYLKRADEIFMEAERLDHNRDCEFERDL
jgi:hypothetical protein